MTIKTENLKTYRVFVSMHHRCYSQKNPNWARYGGRGIEVADEWHDFSRFLSDMGAQPPGMVLDRSNNDGNYGPENCRWVTRKQSARNTSRNRMVAAFGQTKCVSEWAEETGVPKMTIIHRLNSGWEAEPAVIVPRGQKAELLAMFKQMAPALKRAGVL
jgi:hypothetical protein